MLPGYGIPSFLSDPVSLLFLTVYSGEQNMDKARLFHDLSTRDTSLLLDVLSVAYDEMTYDQRDAVFGRYAETLPPAPVDGETLLEEVKLFHSESLAGVYYAPFAINSRNYRHIPEETKEWFGRLGDLLTASRQLTVRGMHEYAVACFEILFELIDALDQGDEIVFGDEIGSWMIPVDEQVYMAAYLASLAATASPEEFTADVLPLLRRDSRRNFVAQAYPAAIGVATQE
jgi:hypothetical protein